MPGAIDELVAQAYRYGVIDAIDDDDRVTIGGTANWSGGRRNLGGGSVGARHPRTSHRARNRPGVPWTETLGDRGIALALKSGNCGGENIFTRSFGMLA